MKTAARIAAALSFAALAACATQPPPAVQPERLETDPMLTILTSGDAQTQLMALVLTRSAMNAGAAPRILLCSAAADLALTTPPADAAAPLQPQAASPHGVLKGLLTAGVQVDVCAIYLPNRPFGPEALLEGVGVAKPDEIGRLIAAPGIRLLNF